MWLERVTGWAGSALSLPAREVAARDLITVGGRTRRVTQVRHIYGAVHVSLHTGELLVLARGVRYRVTRARSAPRVPALSERPRQGSRTCVAPCPPAATAPGARPHPAPPAEIDVPHLTIGLTDEGRGEPTRGECWLCDANGVPVIWLGPVQLPAHTAPLMACQPCTQRLLDRATAHARTQDI